DEKLCKGCNICTEFCPHHVYEESENLNKKGVHIPVPENEERCTKCQVCSLLCPDQAIKVDEEDEN
ncbi:MAG: ferredoxin family protein, partial [Methanobacteriales archaeon]|nr:ferredoxin family protein [Methanobacteriales archaeon]